MHLGALHVRRDGASEKSDLADVRGHRDIQAFAVEIERRVRGRERRREAAVHRRIHHFRALREEQLSHVEQPVARLLHGIRHGHSLEISPVVDGARRILNKWVIGGCIYVR